MDALRADCDAMVLVTPAFPETGRTVYQGNLFVGAVAVERKPPEGSSANPMHDSNLVRVLAAQSKDRDWAGRSPGPCARPDPSAARWPILPAKVWCTIADAFSSAIWKSSARRAGSSPLRRRFRHRAWSRPRAGCVGKGQEPNAPSAASDTASAVPAACLAGSCSQADAAADRQRGS